MTNDPTPTVEGPNELRSRAVSWRRNHGGTPEHKQCDPIVRDLLSALAALREQNQGKDRELEHLRDQRDSASEGFARAVRDLERTQADLDALKQAAREIIETRDSLTPDVDPNDALLSYEHPIAVLRAAVDEAPRKDQG